MDTNYLIIFGVILLVIGSFYFLAEAILKNWRIGSRGREESDRAQSVKNKEFQECYQECLYDHGWDKDMEDYCDDRCTAKPVWSR